MVQVEGCQHDAALLELRRRRADLDVLYLRQHVGDQPPLPFRAGGAIAPQIARPARARAARPRLMASRAVAVQPMGSSGTISVGRPARRAEQARASAAPAGVDRSRGRRHRRHELEGAAEHVGDIQQARLELVSELVEPVAAQAPCDVPSRTARRSRGSCESRGCVGQAAAADTGDSQQSAEKSVRTTPPTSAARWPRAVRRRSSWPASSRRSTGARAAVAGAVGIAVDGVCRRSGARAAGTSRSSRRAWCATAPADARATRARAKSVAAARLPARRQARRPPKRLGRQHLHVEVGHRAAELGMRPCSSKFEVGPSLPDLLQGQDVRLLEPDEAVGVHVSRDPGARLGHAVAHVATRPSLRVTAASRMPGSRSASAATRMTNSGVESDAK